MPTSSTTLLMLHGSGGVSSLGEMPIRLGDDYDVDAPSHPGFDGTPACLAVDSISDLADFYLNRLEVEGRRQVVLVGFSLGGWIAMEMLAERSPRIVAAILVDPIGIAAAGHPYPSPADDAIAANYFDPEPFRRARAAATSEDLHRDSANLTAARRYVRNGVLFDEGLPDRLAPVCVPVLLMWGQDERIVPLASFDVIRNALVSARVLSFAIAEAGHRPHQEHPRFVEQLIRNFLAAEAERGRLD